MENNTGWFPVARVEEVVPLGGEPETWLVGLELDVPGNFWGIDYAPSDWNIEEDASPVGSRRRICAKLSIISFLCCVRASSINSLKGSPVPSSFFSPAMGGRLGVRELLSSRETSSRPNSLYSDLVGDMH